MVQSQASSTIECKMPKPMSYSCIDDATVALPNALGDMRPHRPMPSPSLVVCHDLSRDVCSATCNLIDDEAVSSEIGNSDEHADTNTCFLGWILGNAKSKIMEFIDQILKLAHQIFHTHKEMNEKNTAFDDVVRPSIMISIIVFMIVIITRINKA
ncbi:hypothetical protein B296_00035814 [Ensete ventricosum]|uniref:Transmembrane protein n=1 Tax=Ensete ventricosum TaxID=4639 RepID=A0A427A4T4_ENSVE|nr:hypothetical protein B296_00035814 [Ensete ventricosum]